jgi:hypothetical protein
MVKKRHGVIIETPTEARQAERGPPISPVAQLDICGAWNGCCLVRLLPYLARAVVAPDTSDRSRLRSRCPLESGRPVGQRREASLVCVHPASRPERTISQVVETLFRPDDHHNPLHFAVLVRIALAYPADSMTSTVLGEDNPEVTIGVKKVVKKVGGPK